MFKKVFCLLFVLQACATPSYVTKHGLRIYDNTTVNTPSQKEVEKVTEYTLRFLMGASKIKNTSVFLVNKWIQVPHYKDNGFDLADGHTSIWDKAIIVSIFQVCLADSSLLHELAHIIHDFGEQAPDWWHEDKLYWKKVKMLEKSIIKDLCPSNYERQNISPDYKP